MNYIRLHIYRPGQGINGNNVDTYSVSVDELDKTYKNRDFETIDPREAMKCVRYHQRQTLFVCPDDDETYQALKDAKRGFDAIEMNIDGIFPEYTPGFVKQAKLIIANYPEFIEQFKEGA